MPVKQKNTAMRTLLSTAIVLLFLSSCITTTHLHYSDPNYLGSSEFSSYDDDDVVTAPSAEYEQIEDTNILTDNYYRDYDVANDYYDYSFSSRIRRFHRPMHYSNYYGGLYTDYYYYNNDPFYCGTSIYYGYNWQSPYYSYYSYSPYYNSYNSYYAYGYNNHNHHTPNYTYYNNINTVHTTGHRGSLSSHSNRGVKTNSLITNANSNTSTLSIRNGNSLKNKPSNTISNNTIKTNNPYKGNTSIKTNTYRGNTTIKTNNRGNTTTKTNNSYRVNTSTKSTTQKGNRSYTAPKTKNNNRSYSAPKSNSSSKSYNSGGSKSNSGSRSSGSSNRRSVKPRK